MTITRAFGTTFDLVGGNYRSWYYRDGKKRWADNDQPLPDAEQFPGDRDNPPPTPVAIKPLSAAGQLSAQILTDGAEIHNLRIAELTEAWHDQHRTVCADCIDRDTGERYILTATRISHADGTPDVGA